MVMKKRKLFLLLAAALVVGAVLGAVLSGIQDDRMSDHYEKMKTQYDAMNQEYGELAQLQKYIEDNYYIPVKNSDLQEGTYRGLFFGIGDPYTGYLDKEEYADLIKSDIGEEFYGIGVTISPSQDGYITVIAPIDGGPAAKAGIRAGDKIVKVDGKSYTGDKIDDAVKAMRGTRGSDVQVTVLRDDQEKAFDVKREKVHTQTVKSEVLPENIGYIRISSFESKTADDFKDQLTQMEKKKVKGLVIDLRDNPGGLVDVSVKVADQLLDEGVVTYTQDRKGNKQYYKSKPGKTDLPYVLLVNDGTASAAEIVASAVQDNNGGKLVGVKTFGKGIIQQLIPIEAIIPGDKSGAAIKMTTMQYFSPKGHVIQKKGIEPDVKVEISRDDYLPGTNALPRDKDAQLNEAIKILQGGK